MRIARSTWVAVAIAAAVGASSGSARAQSDAYLRAQDLEQKEHYQEAAAAYREALDATPTSLPALLGLERVYAQLGKSDSLLPILDRAIALAPRSAALRAAQLRTLHTLGDPTRLRAAFDKWRQDVPHDPQPYREYARMLIADGQTQAADTVLRQAQADVGSGRGFEYELAQLRAALGLWDLSAQSWREAVGDNGYLDQAASFSLMPAPATARDAIRRVLAASPATPAPRRVLAALEVAWGNPRAGWDALRSLPPDSAAISAWLDYARRAEEVDAWLPARDALLAVNSVHHAPEITARAAADALHGGDAASAIMLATAAEAALDSTAAAAAVVPTHVAALAPAAHPADAEKLYHAYEPRIPPDQRSRLQSVIARGWIRAGDLTRARAMLASAGEGNDSEAGGWLALYDGDLATARRRLKATADGSPELLSAVAVLQRSKADSSRDAGRAFLSLARGDSAGAASSFEAAARSLGDAAPLLLALAARIYSARGDAPHAISLWTTIVQTASTSPEAPEADLEWARALRQRGDRTGASARLEHLILTYPQSALVPQARRELDLTKGAVP